ncbi:MAG: DUF4872 domain-containing protein [bacterium]
MPKSAPRHYGGLHNESAAVANDLAAQGLVNPLTKKPYSEPLLFGIAGGIDGAYWAYEVCGFVWLSVFGRRHYAKQETWYPALAERLALDCRELQAGAKKDAAANLDGLLDAGLTAYCWVDLASLPYFALPAELKKAMPRVIAVTGRDADGNYLIEDRIDTPISISADDLMDARKEHPYPKTRVMALTATGKTPDVEAAIRAGIADCVDGMLHPPLNNFGLAAWAKWSDLLTNTKDKKGWPTLMQETSALRPGLKSIWMGIKVNTGGGLMRPLYGAFLTEAGTLLKDKSLKDLGNEFVRIGGLWDDLAGAALPDSIKPLSELKKMLEQRTSAMLSGPKGLATVAKINATIEGLPPKLPAMNLDDKTRLALFADLKSRLDTIRAAETKAIEGLAAI